MNDSNTTQPEEDQIANPDTEAYLGKIYSWDQIQIELDNDSIVSISHALIYENVSGFTLEQLLLCSEHYLEYRITNREDVDENNKLYEEKKQKEQDPVLLYIVNQESGLVNGRLPVWF
ncbi:MAG: hypothetical protein K5919_05045 [Clostridiales bacterium]|nr:hypothetical protein [Clostridiales bacterium]